MDLVVKNRDGIGFFPSYVLQRIERGKNALILVTGGTGSGKSFTCLRLAELLDNNFSIEQVCFSPQEFMNLVNGKIKQLKRGNVIVFEELQVSLSAVEFQSLQARLLNYCLSTFRHQGFILLMNCPNFSNINKQARQLFHVRLETVGINKNKKQVILKPFLLQFNQSSGKCYQKYLRVVNNDGVLPIKRIRVGLPSKKLLEAYETKKSEFTKKLNEMISEELARLNDSKDKNKPLTSQQQRVVDLLREGKLVKDIISIMKIARESVYAHFELIRRKGWVIKPIKVLNKVVKYEILKGGVVVV